MITLFDYTQSANNDQSVQWLYYIFGGMDGAINTNPTIGLAAEMFSFFNTTVLTVAIVIVIYIVVVGTLMTTHEGKFMQKWNSLWTPVRVVLGIVCVLPMYPSYTYSVLQHIMIWVVIQGIGAADFLWAKTVTFIAEGQITPSPDTAGPTNIKGIFTALTCEQSAAISNLAPAMANGSKSNYFCNDNPSDAFCGTQAINPAPLDPNSATYNFGPDGSCGTLTYCNQNQVCAGSGAITLECAVCQAQVAALPQVISDLRTLAGDLVGKRDLIYQEYYYASLKADAANAIMPNSQPSPPIPTWIQDYCVTAQITPCTAAGGLPPPTISPEGPGVDVANMYFPSFISQDVSTVLNGQDFIGYEAYAVAQSISAATQKWWTNEQQNNPTQLSDTQTAAVNNGWGYAGGYYAAIANMQIHLYHVTSPPWSVSAPDPATAQPANDMTNYISNYQTASTIMTSTYNAYNGSYPGGPNANNAGGAPAGATFTFGGQAAAQMGDISGSLSAAFNNMTAGFTTGGSSIANLEKVGVGLLVSVETLYSLILGLAFGLGIAGTFTGFGLGTGVVNPGIGGLSLMYSLFAPAFFALLAWMVTLGGTLAVYVPLIPYTIFIFGVLSWIIAVIEAMVAAPLVALGIIAPGGEHEILGKAAPALMLLFSIFLRPSLMIFGLMIAGLVADLMVQILQGTFWSLAVYNIQSWDPLSVMFFLSAFLGLLVLVVNKAFALIHIIPTRVMAWIGAQAAHSDDGADGVSSLKSDVEAATSAAGSGVKDLNTQMSKDNPEGPGVLAATGQARKETIAGQKSGLQRGQKREDFIGPLYTPSEEGESGGSGGGGGGKGKASGGGKKSTKSRSNAAASGEKPDPQEGEEDFIGPLNKPDDKA